MQPHGQKQKLTQAPQRAAKLRFRIEKLEERIAPSHRVGHDPPGQHWNDYNAPPGHSCHRGCNQ